MTIFLKYGSLKLLESSGLVQLCTLVALPSPKLLQLPRIQGWCWNELPSTPRHYWNAIIRLLNAIFSSYLETTDPERKEKLLLRDSHTPVISSRTRLRGITLRHSPVYWQNCETQYKLNLFCSWVYSTVLYRVVFFSMWKLLQVRYRVGQNNLRKF